MALNAEELSRQIPVTLLYKWLSDQAEDKLEDSIAALKYLPDGANSILEEKAVASVAIHNNRTSLWDGHGFLNTCLIMNGIPASADYLAAVDPNYLNYAVWELVKDRPDILIGPHAHNVIIACLISFGYVYPPSELQCVEQAFLDKYTEAVEVAKIYKECQGKGQEDALKILNDLTENMADKKFYRYHVLRLITSDKYCLDMVDVYEKWEKLIGDNNE